MVFLAALDVDPRHTHVRRDCVGVDIDRLPVGALGFVQATQLEQPISPARVSGCVVSVQGDRTVDLLQSTFELALIGSHAGQVVTPSPFPRFEADGLLVRRPRRAAHRVRLVGHAQSGAQLGVLRRLLDQGDARAEQADDVGIERCRIDLGSRSDVDPASARRANHERRENAAGCQTTAARDHLPDHSPNPGSGQISPLSPEPTPRQRMSAAARRRDRAADLRADPSRPRCRPTGGSVRVGPRLQQRRRPTRPH